MRPSGFWQVCAELYLNLVDLRRYWFNHLNSFIVEILFFYAIVVSIGRLGVGRPDLAPLLLAYLAFQVVAEVSTFFAFNLRDAAKTGVLEHLALARGGLLRQLLLRALGDTLYMLLRQALVLGLLALLMAIPLRPGPWTPLALLPLVLAAMGLGLGLGALALCFREVASFFTLLRYLLLPYILAMVRWEAWMLHLPFGPGVHLLRLGLTGEGAPMGLLLLALGQGLLLFGLGFGAMAWVYALARRKGLLGGY